MMLFFISIDSFCQTSISGNRQSIFTIQNVQFKSAGATLSGAILKPEHPHTAVVIVHGSGQEKRTIEMASRLARNGIAVLTYDKRGVGESGGVYAGPEVGTNNIDSANLNLLASDAGEAVQALLKNLQEKRLPIGLIGASQAGWIIPLAAEKNNHVRFIVLFSGPMVTTLEQLRFQFYTNGNANFWVTHNEADARAHIKNDADRYQFSAINPLKSPEKIKIPGLWLYGGKDIQVPVGLSIERLNTLKAQGKPFGYQLFPMLGHNMGSSKSPEPFDTAVKWIKGISRISKKGRKTG
ncbi:prolyl oligopeptidase family serine peptidase [Pedobacter petrophilus]|uniref:Prolyl oligopeptidase family serine peptidase n=2 Tax=Pedobacter petrophilus TaxID=1908241 RepID=A0A7K0G3P8_9SPHI|nr:prolyl oligopeptidase family serine peptidase [Pedobacter petrophilus]